LTANVRRRADVHPEARLGARSAARTRARTLYGALVVVCLLRVAHVSAQRNAHASDTDDAQGFADVEAEHGDDQPDDDSGFADVDSNADDQEEASETADENDEPSPFSAHAFYRLVLGAWVERLKQQPLASARNEIDLALSYEHGFDLGERRGKFGAYAAGRLYYDAAYLMDRNRYDEPTLEQYEFGQLPREIYAALTLGPFRLSTGRQVVSWGQGEVLHVLDRVNPPNLLEPGLTAPDELRVPVLLTHADLELERHRIELVAVHEVSFGLLPPPLSTMSPLRALLLELPGLQDKTLRYRHEPDPSLFVVPAHQLHARYTFRAPFADLTLDAASMLDPLGVPILPAPAAFAADTLDLEVIHPRFELIGTSIAAPIGSFLLRAEAQWSFKRPIALRRRDSPLLDLSATRLDQLDALLGVTYVVSSATSLGFEALQSYLPEYPRKNERFDTFWPVESTQLALRADHALLSDRLRLGVVGLLIGLHPLNTWAARAQVGYAFTDNFHVQLQFIHYQPTEHFGIFYGFTTHDRVVLTTQWDVF
jgi:hypothetical protein